MVCTAADGTVQYSDTSTVSTKSCESHLLTQNSDGLKFTCYNGAATQNRYLHRDLFAALLLFSVNLG